MSSAENCLISSLTIFSESTDNCNGKLKQAVVQGLNLMFRFHPERFAWHFCNLITAFSSTWFMSWKRSFMVFLLCQRASCTIRRWGCVENVSQVTLETLFYRCLESESDFVSVSLSRPTLPRTCVPLFPLLILLLWFSFFTGMKSLQLQVAYRNLSFCDTRARMNKVWLLTRWAQHLLERVEERRFWISKTQPVITLISLQFCLKNYTRWHRIFQCGSPKWNGFINYRR